MNQCHSTDMKLKDWYCNVADSKDHSEKIVTMILYTILDTT